MPYPHFSACTAALALATALLLPLPALAGPGHDHGHDHAAPAASGPALPRFAASSELFELVGVLDGRQLTLYLDRAADNAPVAGAQIELEIDGTKYQPAAQGEVYELTLPAAPAAKLLPVTASISAGSDTDLLAGELDVQAAAAAPDAAHDAAHTHRLPVQAAWAAGGLALLLVLGWLGRRAWLGRAARTGAVA